MTVTLVRPARGGLADFSTTLPLRIRPAPVTDPPDGDLTGPGPEPGESAEPRGGQLPADPVRFGRYRSGEPHRAARRYLDLALEVLGGFRPIGHLRPFTDPARFEQ